MALPFRNVFFAEVEAKTNLTRCSPSKNCRLILQTCSPACNYFSAPPSSVFSPTPSHPFFTPPPRGTSSPSPPTATRRAHSAKATAPTTATATTPTTTTPAAKREREIELGRKKRNGVRKSASWLRPGGEPWVGPPPLLRTPPAPVRLSRFSVRTDTDAEREGGERQNCTREGEEGGRKEGGRRREGGGLLSPMVQRRNS